jgi:hypothetical protein
LKTEFAAMHIGGALVNAITRFAAPAAVAGGQTGAIAVFETGSVVTVVVDVVDVVDVVVVGFVADGFFVPPPERRATRAMITPTTITRVIDRRVLRARRLCRSWTASF